ncbi:MAG: Fur family transcriptional regulator [Candidatus Gracilibacteria bacterium]|nr:Fur family transcriptional regulator [Candidatus Gracilibacteria bacterium]
MDIEDILRAKKKRVTPERIEMFQGLQELHLFQSHDLILRFPHIGRASIFRTLDLYMEIGVLRKLNFENRGDYYELASHHHHEHFQCTSCERIFQFDVSHMCKTLEFLGRKQGFYVNHHQIVLSGLCANCHDALPQI